MITEQPNTLDKIKTLFRSRRFWIGLSGVFIVCSDAFLGEGTVDPETVQQITLIVAAWILGDSLRVTA